MEVSMEEQDSPALLRATKREKGSPNSEIGWES